MKTLIMKFAAFCSCVLFVFCAPVLVQAQGGATTEHGVIVQDVDDHAERARAAGATILREPEDVSDVGLRVYTAEDLEGHRWMFTEPL